MGEWRDFVRGLENKDVTMIVACLKVLYSYILAFTEQHSNMLFYITVICGVGIMLYEGSVLANAHSRRHKANTLSQIYEGDEAFGSIRKRSRKMS